jgi:hypothetical protein
MEEEKELTPIIECPAVYILREKDGRETARGEGTFSLDSEKLTILPASGEPLLIPYRDIVQVSRANYKIEIGLVSREWLTISSLGFKYEDFFRDLSGFNNELILKDMLISESLLKSGIEADIRYIDSQKTAQEFGTCELRIYETSLVIINEEGNFVRIQYCDLAAFKIENYRLFIEMENKDLFELSKMGREFDNCSKALNDAINQLSNKTQNMLKDLFPKYDSSVIRKMSRLMRDGKAASKTDIDSISPNLWIDMEKNLEALGIQQEYQYLKSLSQPERMCIGIKRGLMGDLTGHYFWFLVPIFNTDSAQPGNAIAMEAVSAEDTGKATYFFRITEPTKYRNMKTIEEMQKETDAALKRINSDLITINFRREPVYLTEEQIYSPAYANYQRAIAKIPALNELRRLFIGRVIHHSPEKWKEDVNKLLESNVKSA